MKLLKGYIVLSVLLVLQIKVCRADIHGLATVPSLYEQSFSQSADFVIRWHYQYHCKHVFDPRPKFAPTPASQRRDFNPADVMPGDTIFVRDVPTFFAEKVPYIKHPFIMVNAGEQLEQMRDEYTVYLEHDQLIAWFGIHPNYMAMKHPKYYLLPLGIYQYRANYDHRKGLNDIFNSMRETKKKHLVYKNFRPIPTVPERQLVERLFAGKSYVFETTSKSFKTYLQEVSESVFVLSPRGDAIDCYRHWEAMLCGSIPIIKSSPLDPMFEDLPVLIVQSWKDVNEDYLRAAYKRITARKYSLEKLYAPYWLAKIDEVQQRFYAQQPYKPEKQVSHKAVVRKKAEVLLLKRMIEKKKMRA